MLILYDIVTAINQCLHFVRILGHSSQELLRIQEQLGQWVVNVETDKRCVVSSFHSIYVVGKNASFKQFIFLLIGALYIIILCISAYWSVIDRNRISVVDSLPRSVLTPRLSILSLRTLY